MGYFVPELDGCGLAVAQAQLHLVQLARVRGVQAQVGRERSRSQRGLRQPAAKQAMPLENRELETWPDASRMPRIASVSPGAARPEEMICCTRLWLAFRMDCSSA
jgi:hypothetical protein